MRPGNFSHEMNRILLLLLILLASTFSPAAQAGFEEDLADTGKAESSQSFRDLKARAEAGDTDAQLNMGGLYFKGEGVTRDCTEAAKWFMMAAKKNHPQAQFNLGMMYATGQGVTQNHEEAAKWYRLSAEQGLAVAQLNLGVAYFMGQGVPRSEAEAVKWLRLAVNQGDSQAQFNLAVMYANGQGVPQDFAEAYRLSGLAEAQGHTTAKALRADLKARMSPEQLAEATRSSSPQESSPPERTAPEIMPQDTPKEAAAPAVEPAAATQHAEIEPAPAAPVATPPEASEPSAQGADTNSAALRQARPGKSQTVPHTSDDGKLYLQLGAYRSEEEANHFIVEAKRKLGKLSKSLSIYTTDNWVRVHIGPYPDAAAARRAATQLRKRYGFDSIVKRH